MLSAKFEFDFSDDKLISRLIEEYNECESKDSDIVLNLKGHELQALLINLIIGRIPYQVCTKYVLPELANKQLKNQNIDFIL